MATATIGCLLHPQMGALADFADGPCVQPDLSHSYCPCVAWGLSYPLPQRAQHNWDKPSGKRSLAIQHGEDCRWILQGFKCVQGNFPGSQVFSQHAICTTFGASNNKIGNKQKSRDLKVPNHTKSKNSSLNINQTGRKFIESKGI